ncbi:hypothetical protein JST97_35145 [bacterium]|nr:hypothetical protein [bacterium]
MFQISGFNHQPKLSPSGRKPSKPDPDFGQDLQEGLSDRAKLGLAAGWVGLTTAAGAYIGHERGLSDQVTVEHIPYPETVRVPVGTHTQHGCYQYHFGYNMSSGGFDYHYGYDSSCTKTVTDYADQATGNTLIRDVEHHSTGFPHSAAQGALLGAGVGLVTGTIGMVLGQIIADRK